MLVHPGRLVDFLGGGPVGSWFGRGLGRVGLWFGHFVLMFSWVLYWMDVGIQLVFGWYCVDIALGWPVFLTPLRSSR